MYLYYVFVKQIYKYAFITAENFFEAIHSFVKYLYISIIYIC